MAIEAQCGAQRSLTGGLRGAVLLYGLCFRFGYYSQIMQSVRYPWQDLDVGYPRSKSIFSGEQGTPFRM